MSKRTIFILVVIIVLVAAATWLVVSGRVAVVWKQPQAVVVVDANVCDTEVIGRYNDLFSSPTTDVDEYASKLKAIDDEVGGLPGSDQDPNCLYIRYTAALQQRDYTRARDYVNEMNSLAARDQGQFITAKLLKQFQPSVLEESLEAIQAADAANEDDGSVDETAIPAVGGQG